MEGVTIPSAVPEELKKACDALVKRAVEVKRSEPVISYWCCFAAAQNALKVPRTPQGTAFLMSLLDCLEEMKAALATNEAVTNEAVGSAYVEHFALRIFVSADNDERKGKFDRSVIQRFAVSAQFMEVLRCFEGGMSDEMEQKRKYALWKAADLSKCLREGRTPVAGPPVSEEDDLAAELAALTPPQGETTPSAQSPSPRGSISSSQSPAVAFSPPAAAPLVPPQLGRTDSSQWSTVATPGADGHGEADSWPSTKLGTPSAPRAMARSQSAQSAEGDAQGKSVRFSGPDGAPLSPAETFASVGDFSEIGAPPPTEAGVPPPQLPGPSTPLAKSVSPPTPKARSPAKGVSPPKGTSPPVSKPTPLPAPKPVHPHVPAPRATPPTPPVHHAPPAVHHAPVHHAAATTYTHAPPAPAPASAARLGRRETELVQKHARWAISAMDYDDYDTARKQLLLALSMLPPA